MNTFIIIGGRYVNTNNLLFVDAVPNQSEGMDILLVMVGNVVKKVGEVKDGDEAVEFMKSIYDAVEGR